MTSIALARKWRPQTFDALIGQDHVKQALIHSLSQQRLHHAYLFTGTRGVGKTSIARLLAKALNCEQALSATPCLKCDTCLAIEKNHYIDLIEIDAASKTRVEDTRELLDNVPYAPTTGRYKIYLVDEVHMLSQHSFNALLKTLEEPPAHVKFILATTDPQKLPATILSRCLQFHLKPVSSMLIEKHLASVLEKEAILCEKDALLLIAQAAQGSIRDALSLLDQAIATGEGQVTLATIEKNLGLTQVNYAFQILQALAQRDIGTLLEISHHIQSTGANYTQILQDLMSELHQISVIQSIGKPHPLLNSTADVMQNNQYFSPEETQLLYQIALKGSQDILLAPTLIIGFEMTLLRMHTFMPAISAKIPENFFSTSLEQEQSPADVTINPEPDKLPETDIYLDFDAPIFDDVLPIDEASTEKMIQKEAANGGEAHPPVYKNSDTDPTKQPAPVTALQESTIQWPDLIAQLNLTGLALAALENAMLVELNEHQLILDVSPAHQSLFTSTTVKKIEQALEHIFQQPKKVQIQTNHVVSTPAKNKIKKIEEDHKKAQQLLENDDIFQKLQTAFSAEVMKDSVELLKDDI